jgi:glycosyltransferase involved in cell wall biosynthesis
MTKFTHSETTVAPEYSIVIPVYGNEESIDSLFVALNAICLELDHETEVIFVNDASPDNSSVAIANRALTAKFRVRLLSHSRNFGAFAAIRTGLRVAEGKFIGVISADLQEPPELLIAFFEKLRGNSADIIFGSRSTRNDPLRTIFFAKCYWLMYRKFVNSEVPKNGIDVFACTSQVAKIINRLNETNTSLIGMLFWIGFRREFLPYDRLPRPFGKSSWTFRMKFQYMLNSVYAFSDLPIRIIRTIGFVGATFSLFLSSVVLLALMSGQIQVPGYVPTIIAILFGNSAILIALGILGSYIWRIYENSQGRPFAITYNESKGVDN